MEEDRRAAKRAVEEEDAEQPGSSEHSGDDPDSDIEPFTSQQTDEWSSPREVVEPIAEAIGGFDLDPCSGAERSPFADACYTEADDGLKQPWSGDVWVNPPYSDVSSWAKKAAAEAGDGARVVFLCKGDSSTEWWQSAIEQATAVCAVDRRLSFGDGDNSAPFPSHIFVFGPVFSDSLANALDGLGAVLVKRRPEGGDVGE